MAILSTMRKSHPAKNRKIQTFDLSVRVRPAPGPGECMTTSCRNAPALAVEVKDLRTGRTRAYQACPECRSTAMLHILEGRS